MSAAMFRALIYADSRVLWRDPLLGWILALPIGLALLLRPLIPRVQEGLLAGMGFDLTPYHPLVMGGYLMTAPGMVGMVMGFLFLDERDARTLTCAEGRCPVAGLTSVGATTPRS
jgi:fluoroquinolone transport system permease protein